jgi:hypothetical protein
MTENIVNKADKKKWLIYGAAVGALIQTLHYEDYINNEFAYNFWRFSGSMLAGGIIGILSAYCHDKIYFRSGNASASLASAKMRIATSIFASWGLMMGVFLLAFGLFWIYGQFNDPSRFERQLHSKQTQEEYIDGIIHENGLEGALKQIVQSVSLPLKIDQITTLSNINISENMMQRIFVVQSSTFQFSPEFRYFIVENVCKRESLTLLLTRGAVINDIYKTPNGQVIGQQLINQDNCGLK